MRLYDHRNYRAYLRSAAWQALRYTKMRMAGWICEEPGCRRPCVEVHHLHYERIGYEWLDDLLALCRWHHEIRSIEERAERAQRGWRTRRGHVLPMAVQRTLPLWWPEEDEQRPAA